MTNKVKIYGGNDMKRYLSFLLAVCMVASLITPIALLQSNAKVAQAATITIKAKTTTLEVGVSTYLTVSGTKKKVSWSSSNKSNVIVDSKGKATALKIGTAIITATVSGKKFTCKIAVVEPTKLSCSSLTLNVGKKDFVKVSSISSGQTVLVKWSSSNTKVATVDSYGIITAKGVGTADIKASHYGKNYTCKVTVNQKIDLINKNLNLVQGKTQALEFKGISYRAVWSSSNKDIAYVSYDGKVTAISEGSATITGRVDGTDYKCKVTVTKANGISQNGFLAFVGDHTTQLTSQIPTDKAIEWSSNNPNIKVSKSGVLNVTASGTAIITANINGKSYTYMLVSIDQTNPYIKKAGFAVNEYVSDKVHFVIPATWGVEVDDSEGDYNAAITPYEGSESAVNIDITKTGVKAPEYYRTKMSLMKTMCEPIMRQLEILMKQLYGDEFTLINFKQDNYLSSFGNILHTEMAYNLFGETTCGRDFTFFIDQYKVTIDVNDMGDIADLQKTVYYIINSFYVQN